MVGWLAERPSLAGVGLLVLTVVFGMEVLRVMVPGVVWLLGDRLGLGALPAGGLTLLVFLSAFLAGPLRRALGDRLALVVTAGGLGLLRLVMQLWAGAPLVDFGLAMAGTALFIVFLPLFLRGAWQGGSVPIGYMALGLLAGLALDTAIHGAFSTYDMAWQSGLAPLLVTLFLVLAQWVLLAGFQPAEGAQGEAAAHGAASGVPWARSLTWVAIGPFLFLQLVVFQNIARLAALSGWALPWAFGWTLLSQLIGLAAAVWVLGRRWRTRWPLALACGLGLVVVLAIPYPQGAAATVVLAMLGQVLLSLSMVLVLLGIGAGPRRA
ncbi:MAG: hypothetical protein SV910_04865, partial [Chloroflexota bacterium]|nr:hypothetical protein [Chloroflexota bacterium]